MSMRSGHTGLSTSWQRNQVSVKSSELLGLADRAEHDELIRQSHERCAALGLTRIERPDYAHVLRGDLTVARERNQRLLAHAAPVMEMLCEQIVETESMIVLTDSQGTILHAVGDDDFLQRASKVALSPGVNWSEQSKGTNAIGTALFAEAPTLVHAGEHYMHANGFLTCSATPIFDPRGNILGVLDVTGDHRSYHRHTMGLVRMSARMIENHWLTEDFRNSLRLHFHTRAEFIGTLLEGILVLTPEGKFLGANRSALDQLDMSGAALRMQSVASLFGITVGALVDHFRAPMATAVQLQLGNGRTFYAEARFSWAHTHWAAGGVAAPSAAPTAVEHKPSPSPRRDPATPAGSPARRAGLQYLCTGDAQVDAVVEKCRRVLDRDIPLLILGETGTGKELLARAFHHDSQRARQPFVAVNCASIPETLIEAELFGYEDGAFTGARKRGATGRIVQANGGTLFLDEIGDMPLALQARLLRVLQERRVTPLGSTKSITVDVALVAATHRHLRGMIERGEFREDLYYRLNGLVVRLPALRERSDLLVLAERLLNIEAPQHKLTVAPDVLALFAHYRWPGNLRQLATVLRTAAVMAASDSVITRAHLSDDFLEDAQRAADEARQTCAGAPPAAAAPGAESGGAAVPAREAPRTLEEAEIEMIRQAVADAGGNISVASKRLGISRNTIYRKLRWNNGSA
jgi:sigma-54 dependent transcriptional regulator, acetoin dehydrogenase operon transcriptional activator AcoR